MTVGSFVLGVGLTLILAVPLAVLWTRRSARRARSLERDSRHAHRLSELATLTGGLAHEIRNPLTTLRLNLDLLAEDWKDLTPDEFAEVARRSLHKLATLKRETERLDDILEDFLRYAGQHKLQLESVDLNRVVNELLEFFGPQAAAGHARLRPGLASQPLLVRLDVNLFKQAVLNLLINAQQAMSAAVDAGEAGDPAASGGDLMVRTYRADKSACLEVADTGPGIPSDRIEKIFEAYYSTKRGGTGLGLPTTRRIVEEHAGRIDVHSEPGKGTSFTIRLPLKTATGGQ